MAAATVDSGVSCTEENKRFKVGEEAGRIRPVFGSECISAGVREEGAGGDVPCIIRERENDR